ncbi:hypothetical protein EUA93_05325 [Nocardioides oleivorans]|uniref:Uncharacterized protein n=1 Tax=Nocardioides oleivorans TaxID=273676 RepID=A0A4Q2RX66_9ACTN|nr:hypothetical protein [Nocardioides oleivorans]RYB93831.1 hypothetical protein EUA93_05325 [Nocardioides oleivorans]
MTASPSVVGALAMTLASLSYDFATDELAHLVLTSGADHPVPDRIAWRLQQELGEEYVVARAWRRADIAVLVGESPVLQVGARAMHACDLLGTASRADHLAGLTADGIRMAAAAPDSSAYLLALVTHVDGPVPHHLREVVRHADGIAAALEQEGTADAVGARARKLWEAELGRFGWPSTRFTIGAGSRWGLAVELDAYLIGPLPQA